MSNQNKLKNFFNNYDYKENLKYSYANINELQAYYDEQKEINENENTDLGTLYAKLDSSIQHRTYLLFSIWSIIFFVLVIVLFLNVIGDTSHINLLSKVVLVGICIYAIIYILSNTMY
jgi:hypothetical protein|tara:strand:- start:12903 stop:13256 length:354 start_codon:yes stop_codon:yes gene_type:complete